MSEDIQKNPGKKKIKFRCRFVRNDVAIATPYIAYVNYKPLTRSYMEWDIVISLVFWNFVFGRIKQ